MFVKILGTPMKVSVTSGSSSVHGQTGERFGDSSSVRDRAGDGFGDQMSCDGEKDPEATAARAAHVQMHGAVAQVGKQKPGDQVVETVAVLPSGEQAVHRDANRKDVRGALLSFRVCLAV